MDNIVDYIKSKYPKIVFKPINLKYKNALGFILSDSQLIIGYLNTNGELCKTVEPINLADLSRKKLENVLKNLPVVNGFSENSKNILLSILNQDSTQTLQPKQQERLIAELKEQINQNEKNVLNYKVLYDTELKKSVLISKQFEKQIEEITKEWKDTTEKLKTCREQILSGNLNFEETMKKYKMEMENYLSDKDIKIKDLENLSQQIKTERDSIQKTLNQVLDINEKQLVQLMDKDDKIMELNEKHKENEILKQRIDELNLELENIVEEFSEEKLQLKYDKKQNESAKEKILNEKSDIISKIRDYKSKISEWCQNEKIGVEKEKQLLINEIENTKDKFKDILRLFRDDPEISQLKDNIIDILLELKASIVSQFAELNKMREENEKIRSENIECKKQNEELNLEVKDLKQIVDELKIEITDKDTLTMRLNTIIDNLKNSKNEVRDDIKTIQQRYNLDKTELQQTIKNMKTELESLQSDYKAALKQIENSKVNADKKQNEIDELNKEYTNEILKLNRKIENMNIQEADKENALTEILQTVEKMKNIETQLNKEMEDIKQKYNIDTDKLKSQILQITNEKIKTEQELLDKTNQLEKMKEEMQKQKNNFEIDIDLLKQQVYDMNDINSKKSQEIESYKQELYKVKTLLYENGKRKVNAVVDYNNCFELLKMFIDIHNNFTTKQKIIKIIDDIILKNRGLYKKMDEIEKQSIKTKFETISGEIEKYIIFMNLKDYTTDENYKLLSNKSTQGQVGQDYCRNLESLHQYWNENKQRFMEHEHELINLYEELSKSIRIYIKVNPLTNIGPVSRVLINDDNKNLTIECGDITKQYDDFFGIFNEKYSFLDIYTGIEGTSNYESIKPNNEDYYVNKEQILQNPLSKGIGMYEIFDNLQNGKNVNIFLYGNAKSHPYKNSLIEYGLTNLVDISNIELEYLFEQEMYKVDLVNKHAQGQITNLVNKIDSQRSYDELEFMEELPIEINIKNLKILDINELSNYIYKYRRRHGRIIQTPFSEESTRSNLYSIFRITFNNGIIARLGLIDLSEQESPKRLYNKFFKTSTSLGMALTKGHRWAMSNLQQRESIENWNYEELFDILEGGLYLNEVLNHLLFYFNKRMGKKMEIKGINPYDYNRDGFFYDPQTKSETDFSTSNCLTIPILNLLDTNNNSKCVMICDINQEENYCKDTLEILDFAEKLI